MDISAPKTQADLVRAVNELSAVTASVDRSLRRRTWWFTAVIAVFAVVGFAATTIRGESQDRAIERNADRIEGVVYRQCTDQRAYAIRANTTIDSAIEAEKRKPAPDAKRIRDLTNFRLPVGNCGKPPASR